jgi:TPR repeat protein
VLTVLVLCAPRAHARMPGTPGTSAASGPTPEMAYQLALEAQTTGETGEMLAHLRHAARGGYLPAQEMLGMALAQGSAGRAPRKDYCEARRWFQRAGEQGSELGRSAAEYMQREQRRDAKLRCTP